MKLKVKKLHEDAIIPTRNNPSDSGLDLYSLEDVFIYPGQTVKVRTGIAVQIDEVLSSDHTYGLFIWDRSGLGSRGIHRFAGCIDSSYIGEVLVVLFNARLANETKDCRIGADYFTPFEIKHGDKIAQLVIQEVFTPEIIVVDSLDETDRGDKGFGSSDV